MVQEYITVTEASQRMGVCRATISRAIRACKYVVDRTDVSHKLLWENGSLVTTGTAYKACPGCAVEFKPEHPTVRYCVACKDAGVTFNCSVCGNPSTVSHKTHAQHSKDTKHVWRCQVCAVKSEESRTKLSNTYKQKVANEPDYKKQVSVRLKAYNQTDKALEQRKARYSVPGFKGLAEHDETGKVYGCLTVLNYAETRGEQALWLCRCECGNEDVYTGTLLRKHGDKRKCNHPDKWFGKTFGELTIKDTEGNGRYVADCSCGVEIKRDIAWFQSNQDYTCVHEQKVLHQRFGMLYVERKSDNWTLDNRRYVCTCDCGNTRNVLYSNLSNGSAWNCGCQALANRSQLEHNLMEAFPGASPNFKLQDAAGDFEVDLLYRDRNIGLEVNGGYWHSEKHRNASTRHWDKTKRAEAKGIRLLHFFDWELSDPKTTDFIAKVLSDDLPRIQARKCELIELSAKELKEFEEANHLQGHINAKVRYGLKYQGQLVASISFSKPRYAPNMEWELTRLTLGSYIVNGGPARLLKAFKDAHKPTSIISYCDRSKFTGGVYERLGFTLQGHSKPNYWWYKGKKALSRIECQKHKLVEKGWGTDDQTEVEIMHSKGYMRVYDCGNDVYVWRESIVE